MMKYFLCMVPASVSVVWSVLGPVPSVGVGPMNGFHSPSPSGVNLHNGLVLRATSNVHVAKAVSAGQGQRKR